MFENIDGYDEVIENYVSMTEKLLKCKNSIDLSSDWNCSMVKNIEYPNFREMNKMKKLAPISDEDPLFAFIHFYPLTHLF